MPRCRAPGRSAASTGCTRGGGICTAELTAPPSPSAATSRSSQSGTITRISSQRYPYHLQHECEKEHEQRDAHHQRRQRIFRNRRNTDRQGIEQCRTGVRRPAIEHPIVVRVLLFLEVIPQRMPRSHQRECAPSRTASGGESLSHSSPSAFHGFFPAVALTSGSSRFRMLTACQSQARTRRRSRPC